MAEDHHGDRFVEADRLGTALEDDPAPYGTVLCVQPEWC
jgi:hypothetical protein